LFHHLNFFSVEELAKKKEIPVTDNTSPHPNEELKNGEIKVVFLPPDITSLCQPMDQSMQEAMKKKYCRKLVNSLIEKVMMEMTCLLH
jgi:hypothetical protein